MLAPHAHLPPAQRPWIASERAPRGVLLAEVSCLLGFCRLDRRGRIALRNDVERRSWDFDWFNLGRAYDTAHDLALTRAASADP